ncbi:MAG: GNAT family N-acetyltransferase [Thermoplasmata archaeon]|nr:GNAT family N-acetyltransferase [Thermoplasmata archaeon]
MPEIRLEPMSEPEFARYCEATIPSYAAEHVRAGTYVAEGSVERARAELQKILPGGLTTPGHTVRWIVDARSGERVGHLWLFLDSEEHRAFVYDIEIRPEFRRRGYAEAALADAEAFGRSHGATKLALHVFGHNTGAIALYEKLGFVTTNRMMAKPL